MEENWQKQIKYTSIKQENTMLRKHLFQLLIFQYEISTRGRGCLLGLATMLQIFDISDGVLSGLRTFQSIDCGHRGCPLLT